MYETRIARIEAKVAGVKTVWYTAPSGARYGFDDDDDPGPATGHPTGGGYLLPGPAAASWDDRPPDSVGWSGPSRPAWPPWPPATAASSPTAWRPARRASPARSVGRRIVDAR
jgi:hypothetical protein